MKWCWKDLHHIGNVQMDILNKMFLATEGGMLKVGDNNHENIQQV
jgi:hypothetical protein